MNKLFAICAMFALTGPALAHNSDMSSRSNNASGTGSSQDMVGQPIMDRESHRVGTVERIAEVNGKDAAIITLQQGTDTTEVALKTTDFQPSPNGKGVTVAMSYDDLRTLPPYAPGEIYPLQ